MTNSPKTFGVLHEWNPSPYSRAFVAELEAAAPRYAMKLRALPVSWAGSPEGDNAQLIESTLAEASDLDAMVLISGVFSQGMNGLWRFAQKWSPRPIVSLGYKLPSVASLMMDNRSAVRTATSHLIEAHGRERLLFVRGRKDSHESEERYLGYRHALRDHRLLSDERLVVEGGFTRRGTIRALQGLDPSLKFDGVIAANDDMALAVIEKLIRQGLRVPEDVAVIGFDDIPAVRSSNTALSTIAQPFSEMARLALDSLLLQAEYPGTGQDHVVQAVPGHLILRSSCCGSHRSALQNGPPSQRIRPSFRPSSAPSPRSEPRSTPHTRPPKSPR